MLSLFIIIILLTTFAFEIKIPEPWNKIGFAITMVYIIGLTGFIFGFGQLGHGGLSPAKTAQKMIKILKK
jgi:hypothetical protein